MFDALTVLLLKKSNVKIMNQQDREKCLLGIIQNGFTITFKSLLNLIVAVTNITCITFYSETSINRQSLQWTPLL